MSDERGDEVLSALDALSDAIERNSGDERLLLGRIHGLRRARSGGTGMTGALEAEPSPGTMQLLGRILSRLMDASGTARRALARSMRNEGTSIPAIARIFGVTHQRVSNILNRPAAVPGPVLHEPDASAQAQAGGEREGVG
jgi:DNA invertase Pin-like site-specific DNA recombinase